MRTSESLPQGDFNMPPGVRTWMIPGNEPRPYCEDDIEGHCEWCHYPLTAEDYNAGECPDCGGQNAKH